VRQKSVALCARVGACYCAFRRSPASRRGRGVGLVPAVLAVRIVFDDGGSEQIAADRYSYLAMLGVVVAVAAGFCRIVHFLSGHRRGALANLAVATLALALPTLLVLIVLSRNQCQTWRDTPTLWTHALTCSAGSNSVAHYNMGHYLFERGEIASAVAHYTQALRIDPGFAGAHNNLGAVLSRQGKFDRAAEQFAEALRLDPGFRDAQKNLEIALSRQRKVDELKRP
jgi:tetratricopeptide (TPR) repeat protein